MRAALMALVLVAAAGAMPGRAAPIKSAGQSPKPVRIVLVGDSTVTDANGWGLGFRRFVTDRVEVLNAAANGRSSKSYIDEQRWAHALALKADYYLIQFGHNDEPGKGPERETDPGTTYTQYMSRYVDEARAIGATPILVTSLTRRAFDADGKVVPNLTPYVSAVAALAAVRHVPLLDLHRRSVELAEELGPDAWLALSAKTASGDVDRTHLNPKGSVAVARLVVDELRKAVPALAAMFRTDPATWVVVAADGTGDYRSIQEAIDAAPQNTTATDPWVIFVRSGTYRELLYIQREKHFVVLVGEDPARTVITFDLHASMAGPAGKPIGTFRTSTVTIDADDFTAENLTFENAAGPVGQALAVRVDGDRVVFRNCRFLGWQDTVFLNRGRHYIEQSLIAGHVDFIFGGATAFFDRCQLHCWRNGYITAASTPPTAPNGFVFADSRITGASPDVRTYLGRPWRDFAQVTFLRTEMSEAVRREGWHNWDRADREKTARYIEFGSTGPGARPRDRAPWARSLSAAEASSISPVTVLGGQDGWDPGSLVAHPALVRATDPPLPAPPGS
ncbi:MAG TPA: pectinesterase family protein [Gemmatimonadaceae bacterium]|nr:pectinesterase family protein [Gemmatimonadaceae bacterium]